MTQHSIMSIMNLSIHSHSLQKTQMNDRLRSIDFLVAFLLWRVFDNEYNEHDND